MCPSRVVRPLVGSRGASWWPWHGVTLACDQRARHCAHDSRALGASILRSGVVAGVPLADRSADQISAIWVCPVCWGLLDIDLCEGVPSLPGAASCCC